MMTLAFASGVGQSGGGLKFCAVVCHGALLHKSNYAEIVTRGTENFLPN
jgi:hypothetical protein